MKVFATLATILGASAAAPLNQLHSTNDMRMNQHSMKPSMGMSMQSEMSQHDNSNRRMDMSHQISNIRGMYVNNQDKTSNMMSPSRNTMGQEMRSNIRDMHRQSQAVTPNQYFKEDTMGNYIYAYNDQFTEKKEEGNNHGDIKGHYIYTMPNGLQRQVTYVADNYGFHVRDNADPARIKRSSEPDLVQTKMTSVMDSSSLRDDSRDMHRVPSMMGGNMFTQMDKNLKGMDQQSYSNNMMGNMMAHDSMSRYNNIGSNMMGQNTMAHNMMGQDTMGRNMYNIMSNRGMTSDMFNMMDQQDSNIGRDRTMAVMDRNMMGQDRSSQMRSRNMLGHQDMTPNMMYSNMLSEGMMDVTNNQMANNMMNSNNGLMGQRMIQEIKMQRVPETYTSTRFF